MIQESVTEGVTPVILKHNVSQSVMERELVSRYEFDSFGHAEIKMAQWMHSYNHVRRHGKIKHQTPAEKLANYHKECALPLDFNRPQIGVANFADQKMMEIT